jgi:hypothetical protein
MANETKRTRRTDAEQLADAKARVEALRLKPLRAAARKVLKALTPLLTEARAIEHEVINASAMELEAELVDLLKNDDIDASGDPTERSLQN